MAYRDSINFILRRYEVLPSGFQPSPVADSSFIFNNSRYRLKVRDSLGEYCRVKIFYNMERKQWDILPEGNSEANSLMAHLRADDLARNAWGRHGAPKRFSMASKDMTERDIKHDFDTFRDAYTEIPLSFFNNFYALRNTHYLQVAGYGFYKLARDPARLGANALDCRLRMSFQLRDDFEAILKIEHPPEPAKYNLDDGADFLRGDEKE